MITIYSEQMIWCDKIGFLLEIRQTFALALIRTKKEVSGDQMYFQSTATTRAEDGNDRQVLISSINQHYASNCFTVATLQSRHLIVAPFVMDSWASSMTLIPIRDVSGLTSSGAVPLMASTTLS